MQFVVDSSTIYYFEENKYVLIQDVLSLKEREKLRSLNLPTGFHSVFAHEEAKKILFQKKLSKIAAKLLSRSILRYAFDVVLGSKSSFFPWTSIDSPKAALRKLSTIQPIVGYWLIPLDGALPFFPFDLEENGLYFIHGELEIDWSALTRGTSTFLIFAYSEGKPQFLPSIHDPLLNKKFKKAGYAYGDVLSFHDAPLLLQVTKSGLL